MRRVLVLMAPLLAMAGCSVGQGTGDVKSDALFARDCWGKAVDTTHAVGAAYDMLPDFFAAVPYRSGLLIRVQRGSDLTEVSDGLEVLVDDVHEVRAVIAEEKKNGDAGLGEEHKATFPVAIPAGVMLPGSPTVPPDDLLQDPPLVHMSLYLQRSCHNQNITLNGVSGTIHFNALFDADPNQTSAEDKLTDATFDVQFGDLRDTPFGHYTGDVPEGLQSRVTGSFRFYFERGQPGQPFP